MGNHVNGAIGHTTDNYSKSLLNFLQVLAEFQARGANDKNLTENELRALFEKKVTKNPKFKVHKDRVKLIK